MRRARGADEGGVDEGDAALEYFVCGRGGLMQNKRARLETPEEESGGVAPSRAEPLVADTGDSAGTSREAPHGASAESPSELLTMGVIQRVDMINFMCHRNLSIPLGPRINFIIGHNGSGKSAILTAITIALGGKANTTSRGSSLRDFVREGATAAEVRVQLRNAGTDAFRPAVYGDAIVIERRIHVDGGGAWKIRDASGRVVSTKREELDAICDHANIQVDNPMNILSQDAARQFLGSSQPEDKYSFFLRGTQLTQLAQEYELIQTNIQRMKRAMAVTEDVLPDLERDAREANAKWQQIEQARVEQEKLDQLKEELVWSQVIAKEHALRDAAERHARAEAKASALQRRRDDDAAAATRLNDEVAELEARSRESSEREVQLKEQRTLVLQAMREQRAALAALRTRERVLNEAAERIQGTVRGIQQQIDDEARHAAQDRRAVRAAQEEQRDALAQQRLDAELELASLAQAADGLRVQSDAVRAERAALTAQRHKLEEKDEHLRKYIERCEEAAQNRAAAFGGAETVHALAAIARETHWHRRPIGPLGMHMRLREMRWAPVLESVLSDALNAFLVTNHADRARLARLLRGCRARNQIITAEPDLYDYAAGEPDADVLTILRVLDIDDEHIVRALIDGLRIERSALVRERAQGDELMRRGLRNVQQCYSADLFRLTGGARSSGTQTVNRYTGPPRFGTGTAAQLADARAVRRENESQLGDVRAQSEALDERERALQRALRANDGATAACKAQQRSLRLQMAQIEDAMREDEPANVAALEVARADAQAEKDGVVEQFRALQAQKQGVEDALAEPTARAAQLLEQIELVEQHHRDAESALHHSYTERVRLQKNDEYWARQLEAQADVVRDAARDEEALARTIDEWTELATGYCARVETQRTPASLEEQIRSIEEQMAVASARAGLDVDEVVRELRARNKALQDAQAQLAQTRRTIALLDRAIHVRLEKWHYFRRFVAIRARASFSLHLSNRGFSGSLHFDHNAQTLKLRVRTRPARSY